MEDGAIMSFVILREYAETVKCCDECIFSKICSEYWNQCPAYWDGVQEDEAQED